MAAQFMHGKERTDYSTGKSNEQGSLNLFLFTTAGSYNTVEDKWAAIIHVQVLESYFPSTPNSLLSKKNNWMSCSA